MQNGYQMPPVIGLTPKLLVESILLYWLRCDGMVVEPMWFFLAIIESYQALTFSFAVLWIGLWQKLDPN